MHSVGKKTDLCDIQNTIRVIRCRHTLFPRLRSAISPSAVYSLLVRHVSGRMHCEWFADPKKRYAFTLGGSLWVPQARNTSKTQISLGSCL